MYDQYSPSLAPTSPSACLCPCCSKSFDNKTTLLKHVKVCDEPFRDDVELEINGLNGRTGAVDGGISDDNREALQSESKRIAENSNEESLRCRVCDKSFDKERSLSIHMQIHAVKPDSSQDTTGLARAQPNHTLQTHTPRPKIRLEAFSSNSAISLSKERYTQPAPPKLFPKEAFGNPRVDQKQERKRRTLGKYICELCSTLLANKPVFRCVACETTFFSHDEYDLHIAVNHSSLVVKCKICLKQFGMEQLFIKQPSHIFEEWFFGRPEVVNLTTHLSGPPKYKCTSCPEVFDVPQALKEHYSSEHADSENSGVRRNPKMVYDNEVGEFTHKCDFCAKSYQKKLSLVLHMKAHSSAKPNSSADVTCFVCRLKFSNDSRLKVHMKIHEGRKATPNKICELCQQCFTSSQKLEDHLEKHKRFYCQQCPKDFKEESSLKHHMLLLHNEGRAKAKASVGDTSQADETQKKSAEESSKVTDETDFEAYDDK